MVRVNTWLPDELAQALRERLPGVSPSTLLQTAIRETLQCSHEALACGDCAAPIPRDQLLDDALAAFYADVLWRLDDLVTGATGGTAEGAARIVRDVGLRHRISAAEHIPLPRPSRARREAQRDHQHQTQTSTRRQR